MKLQLSQYRITGIVLAIVAACFASRAMATIGVTPNPPNSSPVSASRVDVSWSTAPDTTSPSHFWYGLGSGKWTLEAVPGENLYDIDALDAQNVYAISQGGNVYYKHYFGQGWQSTPLGPDGQKTIVANPDNVNEIFVAGTNNAAVDRVNLATFGFSSFFTPLTAIWDMDLVNGKIWMAGTPSNILAVYTIATNSTASKATGMSSSAGYVSVSSFDGNTVFRAVYSGSAGIGYLSVSTNGGTSWTNTNPASINPSSGSFIHDVKAVSATEAYAVGDGGWATITNLVPGTVVKATSFDLKSVGVPATNKIIAFGCCKNSLDYFISSSDGINWTTEQTLPHATGMYAAAFPTPTAGWNRVDRRSQICCPIFGLRHRSFQYFQSGRFGQRLAIRSRLSWTGLVVHA